MIKCALLNEMILHSPSGVFRIGYQNYTIYNITFVTKIVT